MNNKQRKNIIRIANKRMKADNIDFESIGFENVQDTYIEIVCKEYGYTLQNFYAIDGKLLNKLLNF